MKKILFSLLFVSSIIYSQEVNINWQNPILNRNTPITHQNYDSYSNYNYIQQTDGLYLSTGILDKNNSQSSGGGISYSGGSYSGNPMVINLPSTGENSTEAIVGISNTTDNHCACGAVDNGNPLVPPCKCGHWKWNKGARKWVHLGNGQGCDCEEHNPIGEIPLFFMMILISGYCFYNRPKEVK